MRWIYLIAMLAIAGAWLVGFRRREGTFGLVAGLAVVSIAGLALAAAMAQGFFGGLRHLTDLLFFVVPVVFGLGATRLESKRHRCVGWTAAVLLGGVGIWSTQIEPYWLEVSHHRIESPKIDRPVRLVVVSDLQTDHWGAYENRVIRAIAEQQPDILLFTGDYFQVGPERRPELVAAFRRAVLEAKLGAKFGAFAVRGDVEAPGWERLFDGLPVTALTETQRFDVAGLTFTGLTREDSRAPNSGRPLPILPSDRFHIAFGHAPDFALGLPPADLMLAGHIHGGQVRLPFVGPLLTLSAVPRSWAVGRTDFADGRTLIVSRGLGMERGQAPRIRFLCRPELVVVDLVPDRS